MGRVQSEAEINGNGNSSDKGNLIDSDLGKCFNWNALQDAASSGEVVRFRELLESNPKLVEALDSQERSLLHLASANGRVDIVATLIELRPEMCLARDRDGANPLHLAAMRGKVHVLNALFEANRLAAQDRVNKGETILHLCVKYDKLDCLEELLKRFKYDEFVNAKDDAGNTILHLAVARQKIEITEQVLSHEKIDVNARNASKQTAMDIQLLHEQGTPKATNPEGGSYTITDLLQKHRAKRNDDMIEPQWIADKRNALIIVAVLMATMAFQAGVIPPGGLWPDNNDGHRAGEAVMAYNYPNLYRYHLRSNTIGFVTSLSTILFLISDLPLKNRHYWWALVAIMCVTFTSMAFTYAFSITVMTPKSQRGSLSHIVVVAVVVWCIVIAIVLLYIAFRFIKTVVGEKKTIGKATAAVKGHRSPSETQRGVQIEKGHGSPSETQNGVQMDQIEKGHGSPSETQSGVQMD